MENLITVNSSVNLLCCFFVVHGWVQLITGVKMLSSSWTTVQIVSINSNVLLFQNVS